ncbi:hypothetical protein Bca52824_021309 [Brassica carinata]|uniref:EamA domain-containing protein n=1 Tax=Brassica carinata TaxID=52824 RepID=A0A8X8B1A5_BRACI|nr:hypothetical protein Bca52824_021309 [Brassica carinata]
MYKQLSKVPCDHMTKNLLVLQFYIMFVRFDYLWAKAVLLTTTTVASARLTIQVPLAAIVDSLSENKPSLTDFIGAAAVMVGFAGINIPAEMISRSKESAEPGTLLTDPPHIVWG